MQPIHSGIETATRRRAVAYLASFPAAAAFAKAAPAADRYKLGVMATMYSAVPLDDAMTRIRKIGYKYVSLSRRHANQPVFDPAMPKPDRQAMLRRIRSLGVEPVMSLGGFAGDPQTPEGLDKFLAQIDLCVDYEIPVLVGAGPWYYKKFPNIPKRDRDWQEEVTRFYAGLEKAVRHAESAKVIINLKPHTGVTARAKDCLEVVKRIPSPYLKISWDAGNVSYYEGIYPDPDLADLAPHVKSVCIKDHSGLRGEDNFPIPGQGNVDHELMFRTLFQSGFNGPMAIERVDGRENKKTSPEIVDQRLKAAYDYLVPVLDRVTAAGATGAV